jgi:hypothetical protein
VSAPGARSVSSPPSGPQEHPDSASPRRDMHGPRFRPVLVVRISSATRRGAGACLDDRGGATALGVKPNGSTVFVTGMITSSTSGYDYATVAYNAAHGDKLWSTDYHGLGSGPDYSRDLAVDPEGSMVFVTGESERPSGGDYATVAYAA